jgi:hypothetical protein
VFIIFYLFPFPEKRSGKAIYSENIGPSTPSPSGKGDGG